MIKNSINNRQLLTAQQDHGNLTGTGLNSLSEITLYCNFNELLHVTGVLINICLSSTRFEVACSQARLEVSITQLSKMWDFNLSCLISSFHP